jgi:ribosome biogenesis ATPase
MVKIKPKKSPTVSASLEGKLTNLVYRLLDEQTAANKKKNPDQEDEFANIALAKNLKAIDALMFAQQKDLSLQRVKKVLLERTLDKVLKEIRTEEQIELQNIVGEEEQAQDDSDFDGVNVDELMDVKDNNLLNKSVVGLWNLKNEASDSTPVDVTPVETDDNREIVEQVDGSSVEKKSKKRSKDSSKTSSKRKKGMLQNFDFLNFQILTMTIRQ